MPKSTKKQKDKSTDFKKAKLKLGKGKKPANNVVDTSFKAQSIVLPTQSIAANRSEGGPSTRKRHNLSELVSLTRHYSPGARKDALAGLRELFSTHNDLLLPSVSIVVLACCKMMADEDASVRKALSEFLDWYLHRIPQVSVLPHAATLILFTTSAQSHIFLEIRLDTIHILNILLDVIPGAVTSKGPSGHGNRVLQGYCSLLVGNTLKGETDATNTSATTLSAQSKFLVVDALGRFLRASMCHQRSVSDELWYLRSSFTSARAHGSFARLVQRHNADHTEPSHIPPLSMDLCHSIDHYPTISTIDPWQETELQDAFDYCCTSAVTTASTGEESYAATVERTLHKFLVEVWLDTAPSAFLGSEGYISKTPSLRLVHAISELAQIIYSDIFCNPFQAKSSDSAAVSHLDAFLSHLSAYLPLSRDIPIKAEAEILTQQLDLSFCGLLTLALLQTFQIGTDESTVAHNHRTRLHAMAKTHLPRVTLWVEDTFSLKATSNHPMGRQLSESTTKAIIPAIWAILVHPELGNEGNTAQMRLLQVVVDQVRGNELTSKSRTALIQFIVILNLLQKEPEYTAPFQIQAISPAGASLVKTSQITQSKLELMESVFLHLPKVLWELGTSHPDSSQAIMSLLLKCVQRASINWEPSTIDHMSRRLEPFFVVQHPTMGTLYGPFSKFPSTPQGLACQKLALDLAFSICQSYSLQRRSGEDSSFAGLAHSVNSIIQGTPHEIYWEHLMSQ